MIKKILLVAVCAATTNIASAKLIDKVAGVINDQVFTLSEIDRVRKTISIRKEIAPFIYKNSKFDRTQIFNLMKEKFIIKDKLAELGYVINDDSVEDRINQTQKSLRLNRSELLSFLGSKGISYNEYFELIREAMEYNIFNSRIIAPLVTITEQELKSNYYKTNKNRKALSFKYKVVDFIIPTVKVPKNKRAMLPSILETYQRTGNIPEAYKMIDTNDLGELLGEDLPKDLRAVLKETDEKKFSNLYIKDNMIHIFYLTSKDLVESSDYLKSKNSIYGQIFAKRAGDISKNWFSREALNYYILENI